MPGSRKPSLTGSPTKLTSSTPAPSPGASATAWTARSATRHDPPPRSRARGYRRNDPRATRSGRRDDSRGMLSAGQSVNIQTNNHRREVGPDQAVAVGPTQVVVLTGAGGPALGADGGMRAGAQAY